MMLNRIILMSIELRHDFKKRLCNRTGKKWNICFMADELGQQHVKETDAVHL
jgi:hypothetical protein